MDENYEENLKKLNFERSIINRHISQNRKQIQDGKLSDLEIDRTNHTTNNLINQLLLINNNINALISAKAANDAIDSISTLVTKDSENQHRNTEVARKGGKDDISKSLDILKDSIKQLKTTSLSGFEPRLSVIRPNVRLADANLAYKYADLQIDFNTLTSFTTLFIGIFISSIVSYFLSKSASTDIAIINIYLVMTIMSLFVAGIFGYLSWQAHKKSDNARSKLEAEAGETEIPLHIGSESDLPSAGNEEKGV
jgi:hypothetical protein